MNLTYWQCAAIAGGTPLLQREVVGWRFVDYCGFEQLGFVDDYGNLYCPRPHQSRIESIRPTIAILRTKVETL